MRMVLPVCFMEPFLWNPRRSIYITAAPQEEGTEKIDTYLKESVG